MVDSILQGHRRRSAPADTVRIVTNDFMYTGGDGYTAFAGGTDVLQPGDRLLDVAIEYITAHSPVAPVVEGRVVRPAVISARRAGLTSGPPLDRLRLVFPGAAFLVTRHRVRSGT